MIPELLAPLDIVAMAEPVRIRTGIYFLIHCGEIVYIGQSLDIQRRVNVHVADWKSGKKFDSFAFLDCPANLLDLLESAYIHSFRPALNGRTGKGPNMFAPMTADALAARLAEHKA